MDSGIPAIKNISNSAITHFEKRTIQSMMKTRVSTHCSPELMQEHAGGREKRGELCALLHGDGFGVDADRVTMEFAAVHDVNRLLCPHRALEAESGGAGPRDVHLRRGQRAGKAEEGLEKKHLQLSF